MKYILTFFLFVISVIFFISLLVTQKPSEAPSNPKWRSHLSRISSTPTPSPTLTEDMPPKAPSTTLPVKKPSIQPTPTSSSTTVLSATASPPTPSSIFLQITAPTDGVVVTTSTVTVSGKTLPRAEVFINDQTLRANPTGVFQTPVTLEEGENLISISANDTQGNYSEKELIVTYEP